MKNFFEQYFLEKDKDFSVIIESNESVAYAYLLKEEQIVGDVWLYNLDVPPNQSNWNRNDMPFLNPLEFLDPNIPFKPPLEEEDFQVRWGGEKLEDLNARIYIRETLIAILQYGSLPGFSSLVAKDGPLATKMKLHRQDSR